MEHAQLRSGAQRPMGFSPIAQDGMHSILILHQVLLIDQISIIWD